jgi:hypothetical protein
MLSRTSIPGASVSRAATELGVRIVMDVVDGVLVVLWQAPATMAATTNKTADRRMLPPPVIRE